LLAISNELFYLGMTRWYWYRSEMYMSVRKSTITSCHLIADKLKLTPFILHYNGLQKQGRQCSTYQRSIETRYGNHRCRGKAISNIYCE
jgi:hypothetical protein